MTLLGNILRLSCQKVCMHEHTQNMHRKNAGKEGERLICMYCKLCRHRVFRVGILKKETLNSLNSCLLSKTLFILNPSIIRT